jgi:tetratricopeptide (TPR) repeat protein
MDRERKQLDEALASDSGSPEVRYRRALFFLREGQLDEAGREVDAALAAQPDEPRYLLARLTWHEGRKIMLMQALRDDDLANLVDHLARTATSANQLRVAGAYVAQRRAEEGFRLIDRALATDPLCWRCQETRAKLLVGLGKYDEALVAVDRMMTLLPEGAPVKGVVDLRRKIERSRRAPSPEHERTAP